MPIAEYKLPFFSAPAQAPPDEPPETTVREDFGAAMRLQNPVLSAYDLFTRPTYEYDPSFDLVKALKDTELWEDREQFVGARNREEMEDIAARIVQERKDRELLANAGFSGFVTQVLAGMLSPTTLIPLTTGATGARALLHGAYLGATAGAIDEAVLYAAQETRTLGEVATGIGATTVLGGILGGGAGALRARAARRAEYDMVNAPGARAIPDEPIFVRGSDDVVPAIHPASGTYRFARSVEVPEGPGPVSIRPEPPSPKTVSYEFTPRSALVITPQSARAMGLPTDRAALEAFARANDHDAIVFQGFGDAPDELLEQYGRGRVQFKNLSPEDQEVAKAIPSLKLKKDGTPRADATVKLEDLATARDPAAVRGPKDEILVLDRAALRQVDDADKVVEFPQFGPGFVNVPAALSASHTRPASAGGLAPMLGGKRIQRAFARLAGPVTDTLAQTHFPRARWMQAQMGTAGQRLAENVRGIPSTVGGDVESLVEAWWGLYAKAVRHTDEMYTKYYYSGRPIPPVLALKRAQLGNLLDKTHLTHHEFRIEISRAMRNGEHEIPEVMQAAKFYREEIYDPMFKELVDHEVIPEDVKLLGDNEYLHRSFNRSIIEKKPQEFADLMAGIFHENLVEDFNKQLARLVEAERRGKVRAKDLNMTYRKATELREKLKEDLTKLTAAPEEATRTYSPHLRREEHVAILRAQAREADPRARKDLLAQARALEAQGGEDFVKFRAKRAELRRRIRNLDQNRFALAEKQRRKLTKVERAEDLNLNALNRTVRSAQKSLRDLAKWDDATLDQEVSKLKNLFADTAKKYDAGEERIGKLTEEESARPVSKEEADALGRLHARAEELEIDDLTDPRLDPEREALDAATARPSSSQEITIRPEAEELILENVLAEVQPVLLRHLNELIQELRSVGTQGVPKSILSRMEAIRKVVDSKPFDFEAFMKAGDDFTKATDFLETNNIPLPPSVGRLQGLFIDLRGPFGKSAREGHEKSFRDSVRAFDDESPNTLKEWLQRDNVAPLDRAAIEESLRRREPGKVDPRAGESFRQMDRADRLSAIAKRLESAEALDRAEVRRLINEGLQEVLKKTNRINSRRALRAERLRVQAAKLDPKLIRAEIKAIPERAKARRLDLQESLRLKGAEDVDLDKGIVDFRKEAYEAAEDLRTTLLGQNLRFSNLDLIQGARGPMRARALNSPSARMEEFLENDIDLVTRLYLRATAPDLELKKKFGSVNGDLEFRALEDDYKELLREAEGNEKLTAEINRVYGRTQKNLEASVMRLRNTWGIPEDPQSASHRLGRVALNILTLNLMGNVAIASIQDPARIVMRQGMKPFASSFLNLFTAMKEVKLSMREARLAGTANDVILHTRSHAIAGLLDDVRFRGTRPERVLEYATSRMGVVALFDYWNVAIKQFAAVSINARLLDSIDQVLNRGARGEALDFLSEVNLNEDLMRRIWQQSTSAEGGNRVNGVWLPNTESWTDREALFAYRAALNREINATIITPGLEVPRVLNKTIIGRIFFQFKSFVASSMSKTLMAGLQQHDAAFLTGIILSTALGMMSYYLWAVSIGGQAQEDMMNASWEKVLDEAIDRSGVTSWIGVAREGLQSFPVMGRLTEAFPPAGILSSFSGERSEQRGGRGIMGTVQPPAYNMLENLARIASEFDSPTTGTVHAVRKAAPYQNVFYLRRLLSAVERGVGDWADLPEKREPR